MRVLSSSAHFVRLIISPHIQQRAIGLLNYVSSQRTEGGIDTTELAAHSRRVAAGKTETLVAKPAAMQIV